MKNVILQNSEFLFGFEAVMTNERRSDQENRRGWTTKRPRRWWRCQRKDCRDILKRRG